LAGVAAGSDVEEMTAAFGSASDPSAGLVVPNSATVGILSPELGVSRSLEACFRFQKTIGNFYFHARTSIQTAESLLSRQLSGLCTAKFA